jgi:hypothetical protein
LQPTTIEALIIIALVLSPGYIFTQVARRLIAHVPESTDVRLLLTVITWGTVILAVAFPFWTNTILGYYLDGRLRQHETEAFRWAVTICLILPVALGVAVGWLTTLKSVDWVLDKIGLGYVDRLPSAWDLVARQQKGSWVKIQLKDDQGVVAGRFGDHSVASLDPRRADVYLEQAWRLDESGNFADPVVDTRGVWIAHDVMAYVLLFDRWEGPDVQHNAEANEVVEDDPSQPLLPEQW